MNETGHEIKGSSTSYNNFDKLKSKGISPFLIDLEKDNNKFSDFLSSDILVVAIPSINIESFKNLILHLEKSTVNKVLFISSTSVYPNTNQIVIEKSPLKNSPLAEIERLFESNINFKTTIIRFGGLFGFDRKPGYFIRSDNKIINPNGYINLIHRDDCISIIEQIIEKDIWNEIFNACSDTHPRRRDFYPKEMLKVGRDEHILIDDALSKYKIVSNDKIKTMLDFKFKHSDLMKY